MLTPQDIQSKKFEKATFGGYDMSTVDDFLERVYADYAALYKENAILKSKLKVLVEKVEEYRATEDSMRMALLTAQKMGNEIVEDARVRGDAILAEINVEAKRRSAELRQALVTEEARLKEAERKTGLFSARVLDLIDEEKAFLEQLKELAVAVPAAPDPAILEQAKAIVTPIAPESSVKAVDVVVSVTPTPATAQKVTETPDFALEEMETSVGAYLAEEVTRMTANSDDSDRSPFVEDVSAQIRARDPFEEQSPPEEEVNFLKMFDRDAPASAPQQQDVRAAEKIDITRSISSR